MKKSFYLLLCAIILFAYCNFGCSSDKKNTYAIIPTPVSLVEMNGRFTFSEKSKIILSTLNDETKLTGDYLALLIKNPTGLSIPVEQGRKDISGSVFMSIDSSIVNNEGYVLNISPKKIIIKAKSAVGMFYAVQTSDNCSPWK